MRQGDSIAVASGTRALAEFVATLRYDDIPSAVIEGAKDLFVDWMGSALAGKGARPVVALERFAAEMGPEKGPSEIVPSGGSTSPSFAALINGAASHVAEQDDVHNGSVFHPGTVVFSAALGVAQAEGASGRELLVAAIAGYEVGIRVGEFLGRSHYKIFHTTGTAGTLASAAAVAKLLRLDADAVQHALGSAGTQAAGLWEFLRDAADSKQLHTAKAAADGLLATYLARSGVTGARRILEGARSRRGDVERRGSIEADRWLRHSVGDNRDVVQVACVVSPHASRGGRIAGAHAS
jgi:2-methylcitrate dehydratase PrpD